MLRGWERTLNFLCCAHDVFATYPPCIFCTCLFCNNVVFGALHGWAGRNLRFTHKLVCAHTLSLSPGVLWILANGFGEVRQDSASDERPPLTDTTDANPRGLSLRDLRTTQGTGWTCRPPAPRRASHEAEAAESICCVHSSMSRL